MAPKKQKQNIVESRHAWTVVIFVSITAFILIIRAYNEFRADIGRTIDSARAVSSDGEKQGLAWIEIDFGNGKKRLFEGDVSQRSYTLDIALYAAGQAGLFDFTVEQGKIAALADIPNTRQKKWIIYRNGKPASEDALENLIIAEGDQYAFRYE